MRSINKVILIGNLTRDPELKKTPNGQSVCTFGLATNRQWVAKDNGKHSLAEFHNIVAWSNLAEFCGKFLKKGKLVYVEGYLKTRNWESEGIKKYRTEIVINDMCMLDKRPSQGGDFNHSDMDDFIPESDNMDFSSPSKEEPKNSQPVNTEADHSIDINSDLNL